VAALARLAQIDARDALPLRDGERDVKSSESQFHGEPVKTVTACILLVLLGLALSVPAAAHAPKQTKAQKDAQKSWKKYSKQYNKQQKQQLKAQQKQMKKWNKNHPTITVT
jgi:hypothetical protein